MPKTKAPRLVVVVAHPCLHDSDKACDLCASSPTLTFCDICKIVGTKSAMVRHFADQHAPPEILCPEPNPNGCACGVTFCCKGPNGHLVSMATHNQLVRGALPPGADLALVDASAPGPVAKGQLEAARAAYVRRLELERAVDPSDPRSGDNLSDDVWRLIIGYLDSTSRYALSQTSRRLQALVGPVVEPRVQFLLNLRTSIDAHKSTMTAIRASATYLLNDEDLHALPVDYARNPHYRSGPMMRLYTIADLEDATLDKYRTWEAFCKRRDLAQTRSADRKTALENARRAELQAALAVRGLTLCPDSRMCAAYIQTGSGIHGEALAMVVDVLHEMNYLFAHTDYDMIVENIKQEYHDAGEWYSIDEVLDEAKTRAARQWRHAHPDVDCATLPRMFAQRF